MTGARKALDTLAREYRRQGWVVEISPGGHMRWRSPGGALVFSASTPSDRRSIANHVARLRRVSRAKAQT